MFASMESVAGPFHSLLSCVNLLPLYLSRLFAYFFQSRPSDAFAKRRVFFINSLLGLASFINGLTFEFIRTFFEPERVFAIDCYVRKSTTLPSAARSRVVVRLLQTPTVSKAIDMINQLLLTALNTPVGLVITYVRPRVYSAYLDVV